MMRRDVVTVMRVDVGDVPVAIDARTVREVLGRTEVTEIPGPTGLVGILPWQGRALAVLDIAPFVGASSEAARPRTLVITLDDAIVAVPIDRAYEPREDARIREAHALRAPFVRDEVELDGKAMPLFDVDSLLSSFDGATA